MAGTITTRREWGATAELGPMMRLPASAVYLHHSVTLIDPDNDADLDDAPSAMRSIERVGVQRFGRYSYSFAVHPTDPVHSVLEGAGLTVGAHTAQRNSSTFGLVFIGNYQVDQLPDRSVDDAGWLIAHLIDQGHLVRAFHLGAHLDVKSTACPGLHVIRAKERIRSSVDRWLAGGSVPSPTPTPKEKRVQVTASMPVLSAGASGQHVAALQHLLNVKGGQRLTVDGQFGPATRVAAENWQRFFRLVPDGIVGAATWSTLLAVPL